MKLPNLISTIYTRYVLDDVKNVCACVVDAMRHSMTYEEIIDTFTYDCGFNSTSNIAHLYQRRDTKK